MDLQSIKGIVDDVARTVEAQGNIRAVFGDAVSLDTRKIIPVATVEIGIGGGGGGIGPAGNDHSGWVTRVADFSRRLIPFGAGGGMGGSIKVRPIGYIHEVNGEVVYSPIGK